MISKTLWKNAKYNHSKIIKKRQIPPWVVYLFFAAAAFAVIYMRSAHALSTPFMYTEDGTWTSDIMYEGFFKTFFEAKDSYLVSGNILLLYIAWIVNRLFFGLDINHLPVIISIVSYLFYTCMAMAPVVCLKNILNKWARLFLYLMIIFMPLGTSTGEIFGRLNNIGYGCFFICWCILLWQENVFGERFLSDGKSALKWKASAGGAVIILCAMTNPVCYLLTGIYFLKSFWSLKTKRMEERLFILCYWIAVLAILLMTVVYLFSVKGTGVFEPNNTIVKSEMIEFFTRNFLYYFTFGFYKHLTDASALALLVLVWGFFITAFFYISDKKHKLLLLESMGMSWLYGLVTLYTRSDLTHQLHQYETTFPDRYFLVQGILMMVTVSVLLSAAAEGVIKSSQIKVIAYIMGVFILIQLAFHMEQLAEFHESKLLQVKKTFSERMEEAYDKKMYRKQEEGFLVEIEGEGWRMIIPPEYIENSVREKGK